MLFISFICLFYLMVLVNSHTISKSINDDHKFDDNIFESINNFEYTTERSLKHARYHHNYRRDDHNGVVSKNEETKATAIAKNKKILQNLYTKVANEFANEAKTEINFIQQYTGQLVQNVWDKVQAKIKERTGKTTQAENKLWRRKIQQNNGGSLGNDQFETTASFDTTVYNIQRHLSNKKRKNRHHIHSKKRRDIFNSKIRKFIHGSDTIERNIVTRPMNIIHFNKYYGSTSAVNLLDSTIKTYTASKNLKRTTIDDESEDYIEITTSASPVDTEEATQYINDEGYSGTAEVEALLNEIKARAVQMIAEQSPSVSDLVTNTVTESTYEADPILNHVGGKPMLVGTLVSINMDHETPDFLPEIGMVSRNDTVVISDHKVSPRSVMRDFSTLTADVEDQLHKEIKCLYNTIHNKVYPQLKKEISESTARIMQTITGRPQAKDKIKFKNKDKSEALKEKCKVKGITKGERRCKDKFDKKNKESSTIERATESVFNFKKAAKLIKSAKSHTAILPCRHQRSTTTDLEKEIKKHKQRSKARKPTTEHTIPALEDEFAMLTLFEQLLHKTHEDNVMKMLTTNDLPDSNRRLQNAKIKLNKRNIETLADLSLKESIRKQNDDGEGMPGDASDYITAAYSSMSPAGSDDDDGNLTAPDETRKAQDDTSYEGLIDKLSYTKFINGYKHYLNFTKELEANDQHFSNLVRYQAHKHHNVDDIGKYILNKIPQIPANYNRNKRYFFDDPDTEDQDVSTKGDDSWFKKHFYLFIETGPPKKFHTSQTVSLKSPVNEEDGKNHAVTSHDKKSRKAEHAVIAKADQTTSVDLDELTRSLDKQKPTVSVLPIYEHKVKNPVTDASNKDLINKNGFASQNVIKNFFAKRRTTSKQNTGSGDKGRIYRTVETSINKPEYSRNRRNIKRNDKTHYAARYVLKNDFEHGKSTIHSDIFDQAALRTSSSKKNKNYGYVDVNLVAKSDDVVKQKAKKNSRFKNFWKKIKFRKHKKNIENNKNKVSEREIHRVKRFRPFKKILNIFKGSDDYTVFDNDRDIVTTRLDAFDVVKYGKLLSPEEMSRQIPNITEDFGFNVHNGDNLFEIKDFISGTETRFKDTEKTYMPDTSPVSKTLTEAHLKNKKFLTVNIHKLSPTTEYTLTDAGNLYTSLQQIDQSKKTLTTSQTMHNKLTKLTGYSKVPFMSYKPTNIQGSDFYSYPYITKFTVRSPGYSTENAEVFKSTKSPVQHNKIKYKFDIKSLDGKFKKDAYHNKVRATKFPKPHMRTRCTNRRFSTIDEHIDDAKIETDKLSTETKFPIVETTISTDSNDNILTSTTFLTPGLKTKGKDKINSIHNIDNPQVRNVNNNPYLIKRTVNEKETAKAITASIEKKFSRTRYTPYPDYFNELMLWHNDILNMDRISSPGWENMLSDLRLNEYTTPNLEAMEAELVLIKEFLNSIDDYKFKRSKTNPIRKEQGPTSLKGYRRQDKIPSTPSLKAVIRHLDNNSRTFPDRFLKAADVVNDINKIRMKSSAQRNRLKPRSDEDFQRLTTTQPKRKDAYNTSDEVTVDTTVLAYDDGVNYITKELNRKNIAKNSLQPSSKKHQTSTQLKAITNSPPQQYYTTPVPMTMDNFDKFLKENDMDVQSVTTPLVDLWKYDDKLFIKRPGGKKTHSAKEMKEQSQKTEENTEAVAAATELHNRKDFKASLTNNRRRIDHESEPEYEMQNLDQLKSNLANDKYSANDKGTKAKGRAKRDDTDYYYSLDPSRRDLNDKIKKKMKIFDRSNKYKTQKSILDDKPVDDVDITIMYIDNDDKPNKPQGLDSLKDLEADIDKLQTDKEEAKKIATAAHGIASTKTQQEDIHQHTMHNNLLYDHGTQPNFTTDPSTTAEAYIFSDIFSKDHDHDTLPMETPEMPSIKLHSKILKKKPAMNSRYPQRVHISSQSVKYDVIYNENYNDETVSLKSSSILVPHHISPYVAIPGTPAPHPLDENEHKFSKNRNGYTSRIVKDQFFNSEIQRIINVVKVVEAVENFTRPNVFIHIDLPTYYKPDTSPTEYVTDPPVNKSWSDYILRYISGVALLELVSKFGNVKDSDGNVTDDVAKSGNASVVFSDGGAKLEDLKTDVTMPVVAGKRRFVRKAKSTTPMTKTTVKAAQGSMVSDMKHLEDAVRKLAATKATTTAHRRKFNLLPRIQRKLKMLFRNATKKSKTKAIEQVYQMKLTEKPITVPVKSAVASGKETITKITKGKVTKGKVKNKLGYSDYSYDVNDLNETSTAKIKLPKENDIRKIDVTEIEEVKPEESRSEKCHYDYSTETDNNQVYVDTSNTHANSVIKSLENYLEKITRAANTKETRLEKRDAHTQNIHTARDVAALEVIVDMMKSTVNFNEDKSQIYVYPNAITSKPNGANPSTNSIQVHIALPYMTLENDKKRSPDSVRVRRVFSAKLCSPVDLEYQVRAYEDGTEASNIPGGFGTVSPGMYLLVEDAKNTKGFALKPIKNSIVVRKVDSTITSPITEEKVATTTPKLLGRVSLSKDFVAAVNKQLLELYENLKYDAGSTTHSIKAREVLKENKIVKKKKKTQSIIDWEAVKRYFGHDRACSCHLKPNQTMCRACAASDAVMSELIFEFNNMGEFMREHCTEIQTYFWMNPTGGRKLRDSVHKIYRSLNDYYKRVKGKCEGRTCQTFSTYLDKREFVKADDRPKPAKKVDDYVLNTLIQDINTLSNDLEKAVKLNVFPNSKLKEEGDDFIKTVVNCISEKRLNKRSEPNKPKKRKLVKNLYSLDNINVNIICKPQSTPTYYNSPSNFAYTVSSTASTFLNYDDDEVKDRRKHKGFKGIFSRHKKVEKSIDSPKRKTFRKREATDQVESPFIADAGGSFWHNYLMKGTTRLIEVKDNPTTENKMKSARDDDTNTMKTTVKLLTTNPNIKIKNKKGNLIALTMATSKKLTIERRDDSDKSTKTDSLRLNINLFSKLFENQSSVAEKTDYTSSIGATTLKSKHTKAKKAKKTKKPKPFKATKSHKVHHNSKTTKSSIESTLQRETSDKTTKPYYKFEKNKNPLHTTTSAVTTNCKPQFDNVPKTDKSETPIFDINTKSSSKGLFEKFKSATKTLLEDIVKNRLYSNATTSILTSNEDIRLARTPYDSVIEVYNNSISYENSTESNFFSETASETYPTIFIIEDYDDTSPIDELINIEDPLVQTITDEVNPNIGGKTSLLISILKYEKDKLRDEFKRFADHKTPIEDNMDYLSPYDFHLTRPPTTKTPLSTVKEFADGDYCIIRKLQNLELQPPLSPPPKPKPECKGMIKKMLDHFKLKIVEEKKIRQREAGTKAHLNVRKEKSLQKKVGSVLKASFDESVSVVTSPTIVDTTEPMETTNGDAYTKQGVTVKSKESMDVKRDDSIEACDPKTASNCICDLHATNEHVLHLRRTLQKKDFEHYVKNITCYKYKKPPRYFLVRPSRKKVSKIEYKNDLDVVSPRNAIKWDWIRNKRSLMPFESNEYVKLDKAYDVDGINGRAYEDYDTDNADVNDDLDLETDDFVKFAERTTESEDVLDDNEVRVVERTPDGDFDVEENKDYFEKYYRGIDDVYRMRKRKRRKRTAVDMRELDYRLRYLPPLKPALNEIYAMLGDNVAIDCIPSDTTHIPIKKRHSDPEVVWRTDRSGMLKLDNVVVDGATVSIKCIEPRNAGNYSCAKGDLMHRMVTLTVIDVPNFNVVFIPTYLVNGCSYDDLKMLQNLGHVMSENGYPCRQHNSVRIDEPICVKDKIDGSTQIRATAIMASCPRAEVRCSSQCRRDLHSSLALLCAANAPALSSVQVVLSKDGVNKTLIPSVRHHQQLIVTHTLRKKDLNGHQEYHKLASSMYPGNVDIVMSCPAGYYLIARLKVCAACPANTCSAVGENACYPCPGGTRALPGAGRCRLALSRLRRYDWWWYPGCGYCVVGAGVVGACVVCALCACAAHVTSRSRAHGDDVTVGRVESRWTWRRGAAAAKASSTSHVQSVCARARAHARPLTPSRVILARFFRPSPSSCTDSQETKFEQWKEKNIPPPLPPIDFDLQS